MEKNQDQVTFRDSFPPGFEVREILYNPYPGIVSGLNTNVIEISNIFLLYGIDSIKLKVYVPDGAEGTHYTQAFLINVDLSSANQVANAISSDYPATIEKRDAIPLTVVPLKITLASDVIELCPDSTFILSPVQDTSGLLFQWSTGSTSAAWVVTNEGTYSVTVTGGCAKDSAEFRVIQSPLSIDLGPDLQGDFGDQIEIIPSLDFLAPITTYAWVMDPYWYSALTCDTCGTTTLHLLGNTTISVTIENSIGCKARDELVVTANRKLFYPTAFSPNADGINDQFYLQSKHDLKIKSFKVFDRWGGLVFDKPETVTNSEQDGWDGKAGQKQMQAGVYTWMAEVVFPDDVTLLYKGEVTLVR